MRSSIIIGSILVARSIDMDTLTPAVCFIVLVVFLIAFAVDVYELMRGRL